MQMQMRMQMPTQMLTRMQMRMQTLNQYPNLEGYVTVGYVDQVMAIGRHLT